MPAPTLALLIALSGPPADTGRLAPLPDSSSATAAAIPARSALAVGAAVVPMDPGADTVPRRRRSVEVSEWYERRLRLHRYGAYTIIPLFAFQAVAGNQVFVQGDAAPGWARTGHRAGAAGLATVFTLNTVTGLWNLWDSRSVSEGRTRRTAHSLLMLASDAGFTYAGVRLSEQAENDLGKRRLHRRFAYGSMATALAGASLMVLDRD